MNAPLNTPINKDIGFHEDKWFKNDYRDDINANGYAKGETTSAGFSPNPMPGQLGGIPPINTNSIGNPISNQVSPPSPMLNKTSNPGTSLGGYFVPNTDFMK